MFRRFVSSRLSCINKHYNPIYHFKQRITTANPPTATLKSVRTRSLIKLGLEDLSPNPSAVAYYNLSYGELADHQARNKEGLFANNGAFAVDTGKFTGRSPLDKYIVKQEPSASKIWWGDVNRVMEYDLYQKLKEEVMFYYKNKVDNVYVLDAFCGASKSAAKKIRFITEKAWHHHFVKNMFIEAKPEDLKNFEPDFTVINCYGLTDDKWQKHGLHSDVYAAFSVEDQTALIGGAWYGGEMKKGIFSMMHYWLPQEHILSMHCSANIGFEKDDVCLFFGLSGTGKTTLSTDAHRRLIGDDEHGWDDEGIFNFEGGCYAKTSKLSLNTEPEIYRAIRGNALLENVWIDPNTREPDYFNMSLTENGRVSYPIEHIENREASLAGGHPEYIIFLCCDAFGTLPPVAKLNPGQSMYHFISGYTAKVAGTERGIKEPVATFSPCYGAAFLTLHPMEYAALFKEKLEKYNTDCYLVNTGWSGGAYGVDGGERMSIKTTRSCIDAIFNGSIKKCNFRTDKIFGFQVPTDLPGVDSKILDPRNTWKDANEYDKTYKQLGEMFAKNIDTYADPAKYKEFGPTSLGKEFK
eukprot:270990_1